ncbi:hypothetical protein F4861DRAFT_517671 [Xylaria intraflava]|nr:hypothetical protein F4861DRAFT_517671 [Xylaria intraflava]
MSSPSSTTPVNKTALVTKDERRERRKQKYKNIQKSRNTQKYRNIRKSPPADQHHAEKPPRAKPKERGHKERARKEKTATVKKELSQLEKLVALQTRINELKGYVNQIQDVVTIGMHQLRELKVSVIHLPLAEEHSK